MPTSLLHCRSPRLWIRCFPLFKFNDDFNLLPLFKLLSPVLFIICFMQIFKNTNHIFKLFTSFVHHLKFLKPLCCCHVLLRLFPFHLLLPFLLPSQRLKTCRILESPLFHQPFILLFLPILILLRLFLSHVIVHHRTVLLFYLFLNLFKFLVCLRISLFVFLLSNLKILRLNDVIFEIDVLRKLKVELRELMSFKVIKVDLLKFEGVISFIFKFFHHLFE